MRFFLCFNVLAIALSAIFALGAADRPATKIIMLGTGTPRPNPDRSGPATAIVVGDRAYLIDFGPGVVRRAAAAATKGTPAVDPVNIKVAFLTHLHSDHTAGYPDLMLTPWIFGRKELDVYGPEGTEEMTRNLISAYRQASRTAPREWSMRRRSLCAHTTRSLAWSTRTTE